MIHRSQPRTNHKSQLRTVVEDLIRTHGTIRQYRDDYWVWNDAYANNRRRLKWWGIYLTPTAFEIIKKEVEKMNGVVKVYRNSGKGRYAKGGDLCVLIDRPLRKVTK